MTAKPSQRGNDDSKVLKFKDFQGPLTANSKTFKALLHFQGLYRSWKNGKNFKDFPELSRPCGHLANRVGSLGTALLSVLPSRSGRS